MTSEELVRTFMSRVWNSGDLAAVDQFVASQYTIHSDPGDPWDGQTLDRDTFRQRLLTSRAAFPDLSFGIEDAVCSPERVAIAWTMRGTNTAPMGGRPATGSRVEARGITIYYCDKGYVTGHRQVVDRLTVVRQMGLAG